MEETILQKLQELIDKDYCSSLEPKYPANARPFIGVPIVQLHEMARELACRKDWREIVDSELTDNTMEEVLLQAMITGCAQPEINETLLRIKKLIEKIDSTYLCNAICLAFRAAVNQPEEILQFLKPYLNSKTNYGQRFAIVTLLDYYVNSDSIDTTLQQYSEVQPQSDDALEALAWGYRICFLGFPKKTLTSLQQSQLNDATFNLLLEHLVRSPRIYGAQLQLIEALRRPSSTELPHANS